MTNATNTTDPPSSHDLRVPAFLFSIIILAGLILYCPVLWVTVRQRKGMFNAPFYSLVFCLAVADIARAAIYGQFYLVPTMLVGGPLGGYTAGQMICIFEAICFVAVAGSTFVMSLSRFFAVMTPLFGKPKWNTRCFGHNPIKGWIVGLWVHAVGVVGALLASGCNLQIADSLLSPMYVCETPLSRAMNHWVGLYITILITFVLLVINIGTLAALLGRQMFRPAASSDEKKSYRMEVRFFVQSFMVYLGLLLNNGFFQLVSIFNLFYYEIFVLLGCFMFLNSTLSPVIYIVFNKQLRNAIFAEIGMSKSPVTTMTGAVTQEPTVTRRSAVR